jgi:hypothetical protein
MRPLHNSILASFIIFFTMKSMVSFQIFARMRVMQWSQDGCFYIPRCRNILDRGLCCTGCGSRSHELFCYQRRHGRRRESWRLSGADAHCAKLANAAGSTGQTWHAYLSTQAEGKRGISARDRIGNGPWHNAKGVLIANDLDQLHILPNLVKSTALDENGALVKGRGDKPNEHDILTGSKDDGTAYFPWEEGDKTCSSWTSNGEGSATVGHHDRHGGGNVSWNAAHNSGGCSQDNLKGTGGAGLFYCFAAN